MSLSLGQDAICPFSVRYFCIFVLSPPLCFICSFCSLFYEPNFSFISNSFSLPSLVMLFLRFLPLSFCLILFYFTFSLITLVNLLYFSTRSSCSLLSFRFLCQYPILFAYTMLFFFSHFLPHSILSPCSTLSSLS